LIYSVVSYLRHKNSDTYDKTILYHLLFLCLKDAKIVKSIDDIISDAENISRNLDPLNREMYYQELEIAENMESRGIQIIEEYKLNPMEIIHIFGEIMVQLSIANLYRTENYIIPSTTVQVVKIEQAKEIQSNTCDPILTKIAKCSLGKISYILSAIEQLGYLQEKLDESQEGCSLDANKYLGRFLRAVKMTKIIKNKKVFNELNLATEQISQEKIQRGQTGNLSKECPKNIDIYGLLKKIF
jgi:hypothetical protein